MGPKSLFLMAFVTLALAGTVRVFEVGFSCLGLTSSVILSGLDSSSVFSFIWDRFVQWFLDRGHPVLVFDFYGHGYSDIPSSPFSIELFLRQFENLLEHLHIKENYSSFILIGHSMGGLISSEFTSKHKEMVSKLILLNCAGISIQKSIQNPLPSVLRIAQEVIRKTKYLDHMVHLVSKVLQYHGNISKLTPNELSVLAQSLDEDSHEFASISSIPSPITTSLSSSSTSSDIKKSNSANPSLFNRFLSPDQMRVTKALSFLYKSWIHQCSYQSRGQVLFQFQEDVSY